MKLATLLGLASLTLSAAAQTPLTAVTVRAEQVSDVDVDLHKKTQEKSLRIYLNNSGSAEFPTLNVKYFFFGKEGDNSEVVIIDEGALPAAVKAHAATTLNSPVAKADFTEEHYEKTYKKGVSPRNAPRKKVAAKGERITGYGVQVFNEGKLLSETFSEASLKKALSMSALP